MRLFSSLPRRIAPLLAAITLIATVGCSTVETTVIEETGRGAERQSVLLLTGTPPVEAPPAAGYAQLSALQAEQSLQRLVVRPSGWISFVRGEPEPFLSPPQRNWMARHIGTHLRTLSPTQRLQFEFADRFKHYEVQVQVYAEGEFLVYRFGKLAVAPQMLTDTESAMDARVPHVALEPQTGQVLEDDPPDRILKDPVLVMTGGAGPDLAAKLSLLEDAVNGGILTLDESRAMELRLRKATPLTPAVLKSYLAKRETLNKAYAQGLFTDTEFQQRLDGLNADLGLQP